MFRGTETILKYLLRANEVASSISYSREMRHMVARKQAFSDGRSAVFIWVPKNAGTSLFNSLYEHAGFKKYKNMKAAAKFNNSGPICFGHMKISGLVALGLVDDSFLSGSFKFGICRNPYSRAVSLYKYYQSIKRFPVEFSFNSFLRSISDDGVNPVGLYNCSSMSLANPQTSWLLDIPTDYIGRFEELEVVMPKIYRNLNINNVVENLPHFRNSGVEDFRKFYDRGSIDIVNKFYESDFQSFGYEQVTNAF